MLKIAKTKHVKTPTRSTEGSAGLDFYVPSNAQKLPGLILEPGQSVLIPSGIRAEVPKGFALIMFNKSGVATRQHLQVGACVIDEDYQGEIHLHVTNIGLTTTEIVAGQKLTQGILLPVNYASVLEVSEPELHQKATSRASGAFGSTGLF